MEKDERRDKQRQANAGRAAKMHAARLANATNALQYAIPFSGHDITPHDHAIPLLNVGCSGWFYWDWKDKFYPRGLPTKQWLEHYAHEFQTVELNAPFYSWPTVATVKSWIRQTQNQPLIYTVKVCELITHTKRFVGTKELIKDFGWIGDLLGSHMGCFLFQLPPSFQYTPSRLKRILDQLNPSRRNIIEFRHHSWWNEHAMAAFRKAKTIFCSCSAPGLPDELVKTADEVYIRFHGPKKWYRHRYTNEELAVWAGRIRDCKANRIWAYFNNSYEGHAVDNARELRRQLSAG
jgi:uncharacterized protein YecE (DUF72 family)